MGTESRLSRMEQQFAFIKEIDGVKKIGRQSYLKDGSRKENDADDGAFDGRVCK